MQYTHDEHLELFNSGKKEDLDKLIESFLPMCNHIAKEYTSTFKNVSREDLFQEAAMNITEKINKWEPSRGKLSTFLSKIIYQRLYLVCLSNKYTQTSIVDISLDKKKFEKAKTKLRNKFKTLSNMSRSYIYDLDLAEQKQFDPSIVRESVDSLNEEEKSIICDLYGLNGPVKTKIDISKNLGIPIYQLDKIIKKCFRKLRSYIDE